MSLNLYTKYSLEDGSFLSFDEDFYDIQNYLHQDRLYSIIRSPIMRRNYRIYLLHEDETIKKEITEYVLSTGNIEKNGESGQRRSTTLTFANILVYKQAFDNYKTYGQFSKNKEVLRNPLRAFDDFENNAKIKIVTEIKIGEIKYEFDEGIFVIFDPQLSNYSGNNSLTLQLYDKFSLLDGTIDGKGELDYEVPVNTPIYEAIRQLLRLPKNNRGESFDVKEIIFPIKYMNELLAYTIKKTSDNSIGELIKEMALSISCDVGYNVNGNLEITDSLEDMDYHYRHVAWEFKDNEWQNPSINIKRSQIKNKVIVVGANINGYLCKGVAENTNPNSLYNIYGSFGIKSIKISDNLIPSNKMCADRARYELKKYMKNYITIELQTIWLPHLEPGDIVRWSNSDLNIDNEDFIVNSISLPLNGKDFMHLNISNLKEISY